MKLKSLQIKNFRVIKDLEIDFVGSGSGPRQITALIGDNGSGKTTVLQAIALVLSLATRRTKSPEDFLWHGFMPERVSSLGPTYIELEITMDQAEICAVRDVRDLWNTTVHAPGAKPPREYIAPPGDFTDFKVAYESGVIRCGSAVEPQLLGRYLVKAMLSIDPSLRKHFAEMGDVFWFDQDRNLGAAMLSRPNGDMEGKEIRESWQGGVERLREYLIGWWGYHTSPEKDGGKDYISELEPMFERVFPSTKFRGLKPRELNSTGRASDFYFLLERQGRVFDIGEMSSGEQAVFPLLYEFVRLDIAKSIVLIDELELHLHPPQQQALLAALPKIGPDCQFIISTHSPYLEEVIPDEHEVRLDGGRSCL
ncbi:MAG: AAA family ATPase [Planctomycetota bacterium]